MEGITEAFNPGDFFECIHQRNKGMIVMVVNTEEYGLFCREVTEQMGKVKKHFHESMYFPAVIIKNNDEHYRPGMAHPVFLKPQFKRIQPEKIFTT